MSTSHPAFTRLDKQFERRRKSQKRSPQRILSKKKSSRKTRRKISPKRKSGTPRPKSPLSNERDIKELLKVNTLPKERKTPKEQKTLKDLAIEIANSEEKQPGCFGKLCKKVASKFTRRRRGGKRKRRKTRKRRKGHRGSPPQRR